MFVARPPASLDLSLSKTRADPSGWCLSTPRRAAMCAALGACSPLDTQRPGVGGHCSQGGRREHSGYAGGPSLAPPLPADHRGPRRMRTRTDSCGCCWNVITISAAAQPSISLACGAGGGRAGVQDASDPACLRAPSQRQNRPLTHVFAGAVQALPRLPRHRLPLHGILGGLRLVCGAAGSPGGGTCQVEECHGVMGEGACRGRTKARGRGGASGGQGQGGRTDNVHRQVVRVCREM